MAYFLDENSIPGAINVLSGEHDIGGVTQLLHLRNRFNELVESGQRNGVPVALTREAYGSIVHAYAKAYGFGKTKVHFQGEKEAVELEGCGEWSGEPRETRQGREWRAENGVTEGRLKCYEVLQWIEAMCRDGHDLPIPLRAVIGDALSINLKHLDRSWDRLLEYVRAQNDHLRQKLVQLSAGEPPKPPPHGRRGSTWFPH